MNIHDPKVQKLLLVLLLVGGIQYAYFFTSVLPFGYQPRQAKIQQLTAEYGKLSAEITQARRLSQDMTRVEALHRETQRKWEIANELLPPKTDMAGLLRLITLAGHSAGVKFVGFEPDDSKNFEYYAENPVEVEVVGGYHQVGTFLSEVARLSRLITVRMPKVETLAGGDADETVRASFLASAYSVSGDHVRAKQESRRAPVGGPQGKKGAPPQKSGPSNPGSH